MLNKPMKNYNLNIIIRLTFILLSMFFLIFLYQNSNTLVSLIFLSIIVLLQIIFLFRYVNQVNIMLFNFFNALEFSDFSQSYSVAHLGKSFKQLEESLAKIKNSLKETRHQKEKQYQFYQAITNNTSIGILVYDKKGNVQFFNKAIKRIFNVHSITSLASFDDKLRKKLLQLQGGSKETFILKNPNETLQLSLQTTEIIEGSNHYILLSVQNIQTELNKKEVETWQKLIKVLTHEIMNSITPISSLVSTIDKMLVTENIPIDDFTDIKNGLSTIKRRSEGLFNFVDKYRNLTKIPKPNKTNFLISTLLDRVESLMNDKLNKNNIILETKVVPPNLKLEADTELIEQILINLILNAVSALEDIERKNIKITAYQNIKGKVEIAVKDNGVGISDKIKEQIFIPFYTTRKTGTGIGLSLSKQIMNLHGGEIKVDSTKNEGSTFYLIFSQS